MNGIKVLVLASLLVGCTVFGEKYSRAMNYNPIIDMVNRYGIKSCATYEMNGIAEPHFIKFEQFANGFTNSYGLIGLEIFLRTTGNAHILLTNTDQKQHKGYVIVFGSDHNEYSQIRRNGEKNKDVILTNLSSKGLIKESVYYKINIAITSNGKMKVYVDNIELLKAIDTDPIGNLKYIGFTAWPDYFSSFFYNCSYA